MSVCTYEKNQATNGEPENGYLESLSANEPGIIFAKAMSSGAPTWEAHTIRLSDLPQVTAGGANYSSVS
jgi:hypothetical protein